MDFHLLSHVRQTDGGALGELRHVVLNPQTRELVSIVVQPSGYGAHAVVVPIGAVDAADDDAVYLRLTPQQLNELEPYAIGRNVAPPPAEVDPETASADLEEEPFDVPDVPPVGAAAGISSIAFTPVIEVVYNVPEGACIIDDGTIVLAADAELGRVTHILTENAGYLAIGLTVEAGGLFPRDVEISMDIVAHVQDDRVVLSVDRSELVSDLTPE